MQLELNNYFAKSFTTLQVCTSLRGLFKFENSIDNRQQSKASDSQKLDKVFQVNLRPNLDTSDSVSIGYNEHRDYYSHDPASFDDQMLD